MSRTPSAAEKRRFDHVNRERRDSDERLDDYYERRTRQGDHTPLPFPLPWTDQLRVLLCGVHDPASPLTLLRGHETAVLRHIYELVVGSWKASVKAAPPTSKLSDVFGSGAAESGDNVDAAFSVFYRRVRFPAPADRNVNMMPFRMGDPMSLPEDLRVYYRGLIERCPASDDEYGKVCYLTVMESYVEAGETQRRGGLHVEAAGSRGTYSRCYRPWGGGANLEGGFYLASNVARTTEVFEDLVDHSYGTVDKYGGIEHLRPFLGQGILLGAGELAWLTDRTPHEALPQPTSGYRQFFRLVTSNLSHWYEEHSTPNPKVALPKSVQVVKGSKF